MLVFASCQKQPTANFSTDKTSYVGGETIYLTNQSTDADHYEWYCSDGQQATTPNLTYTTTYGQDGTLSFELLAYSKNGKKSSTVVKSVTVTPAKGDITFWIQDGYITTVYIQNISREINMSYQSTPDCGSDGCANYNDVDPGTYSYYATNGVHEWSGTVTAYAGECSTMKLYISKSSSAKNQYEPKEILSSF